MCARIRALWKKHVVLHKFSPVQEHDVNKQMSKLLTSCWKRDTDKRPSAQEALDMLTEAILEKVLRNRFARTIWQAALDKQYEVPPRPRCGCVVCVVDACRVVSC